MIDEHICIRERELGQIGEALKNIDERQNRHHTWIGNVEEAVDEKVDAILKEIRKTSNKKNGKWILWAAFIAAVGSIVSQLLFRSQIQLPFP